MLNLFLLLPIDWFIDYEPPWLGVALMLVGIFCVAVSYVRTVNVQQPVSVYLFQAPIMGVAVAPWALVYPEAFIIVLSFTGSWFQGVGIVRGVLKLRYYLHKGVQTTTRWLASVRGRNETATGGDDATDGLAGVLDTIGWMFVFQLAGLLALITSVWVGVGLTVYGELTIASLTTDFVISWTLLTLFGSVLGLTWRFWSVRDALPPLLLTGIILLTVGAELYNVRSLQTDLALFLINKIIFVFGFVGSVAVFIIKWREARETSSRSVRR